MRLGVGLVGEHRPRAMIDLVQRVEELGYDMAWFTDERFHRDVFVNMTLAAGCTQTLSLGCMVTDPFVRHPALTAAAAATLDDVSGGRFVLGLGAGISGFKELGIERRRPAIAIAEAAELIIRLTAGERDVELRGDIVQFGPGHLDFVPERRTPIVVAGRGPKILEAAGAVADGVVIGSYATPEGIRWGLQRAAHGAARAARSIDQLEKISWLYTSVADEREAAFDAVRVGVAVALSGSYDILETIGIELPQAVRKYMEEHRYRFDRGALTALGALLPSDLVSRFAVAGTVGDVVEKLAMIKSLGIQQAALWPFPARGTSLDWLLSKLALEVKPALDTGVI